MRLRHARIRAVRLTRARTDLAKNLQKPIVFCNDFRIQTIAHTWQQVNRILRTLFEICRDLQIRAKLMQHDRKSSNFVQIGSKLALLAATWGLLSASCAQLGRPWAQLGVSWAPFGPNMGAIGRLWRVLGPLLRRSWAPWVAPGPSPDDLGSILDPQRRIFVPPESILDPPRMRRIS